MSEQQSEMVIIMDRGDLEKVSYPENDHLYPGIPVRLRTKLFPDVLRDAKTGEVVLERKWTYKEIQKMRMDVRLEMFGRTDINLLARDISLRSVRDWSFCIPYLRKQRREREKAQQSSMTDNAR